MRTRKSAGGFTLVEILVVLILTGLVTTLLFQGLQQTFRLQRHFGAETFSNQEGAMQVSWFRHAVNGLMPDHADGSHRFKGEPDRLTGLTIASLDATEGSPSPIELRFRFDARRGETILESSVAGGALEYRSWPGNSGRFSYYDDEGKPHGSWPPFLGKWPQLPSAIVLEADGGANPEVIVAAIRGPKSTTLRLRDVQGF